MACCRCNRAGTCRNCSCRKAGSSCSSCLPAKLGNCLNLPFTCPFKLGDQTQNSLPSLPPLFSIPPAPTGANNAPLSFMPFHLVISRPVHSTHSSPLVSTSVQDTLTSQCLPSPSALPPSPVALPSLATINELRVSTLQHVPKGTRDDWARMVGEALQGILSDPASIDAWCKWFMLARCVFTNPT